MNKWLGTPIISHFGHLEGEHPYSGDLPTIVRNVIHLLTGMILHIGG